MLTASRGSSLWLLTYFQRCGAFVFSGRRIREHVIYERYVYFERDGIRCQDGDAPVICASDELIIPTFMALTPPPPHKWAYYSNGNGEGLDFIVSSESKLLMQEAIGYVAVLYSGAFRLTELGMPEEWPGSVPVGGRRPEWRRRWSDAIPYCYGVVTLADFLALLSEYPGSTFRVDDNFFQTT
jgi:hypothetical protein